MSLGFCSIEETGFIRPNDAQYSSIVSGRATIGKLYANCVSIQDANVGRLHVNDLIVDNMEPTGGHIWESVIDSSFTDVVRYNATAGSVLGNESILIGISDLNKTGRQTFWYSPKSAFRCGTTTGSQWNISNIGEESFAVGQNTLASGDQSICFGLNNESNGNQSSVFGFDNIANGPLAFVAGGSNTLPNANHTFVLGNNIAGEAAYSVLLGGNNPSLIGLGANTGIVTGPLIGSFAAFDASPSALHTLWENNQNKQLFQSGFVRGSGSQAFDGDTLIATPGNDGAREKMLPFRFFVSAGSSKTICIGTETNQVAMITGVIVAVGDTMSKRSVYTVSGGVFTNDAGFMTIDKVPTVSLEFSSPMNLFDLNNVIFNVTNVPPCITVNFTAPIGESVSINFVTYLYDVIV